MKYNRYTTCVSKKHRYGSEAQASRAVNKYSDLKRHYFCKLCGGFHTTSQSIDSVLETAKLEDSEKLELQNKKLDKENKRLKNQCKQLRNQIKMLKHNIEQQKDSLKNCKSKLKVNNKTLLQKVRFLFRKN